MALTSIKFLPGIDKQDTAVGASGRWVDSDNVRFRYGLPEKVGGWTSLLSNTICGVARKQHAFVDLDGSLFILSLYLPPSHRIVCVVKLTFSG